MFQALTESVARQEQFIGPVAPRCEDLVGLERIVGVDEDIEVTGISLNEIGRARPAQRVHVAIGVVSVVALAAGTRGEEIGLRALAALIATIGGEAYPPRFERLERLAGAVLAGSLRGGRTLGGCRILPYRGRVLILREFAATAAPVELLEQGELLWDNRFLAWRRGGVAVVPGLRIGALGVEGAASMRALVPAAIARGGAAHHLPGIVRPSLPAFWQDGTLLAVPHLGWRRSGIESGVELRLRPARPLLGSGFTVV